MITLMHDLVIDVSQTNFTLMLDKHKTDKKGNALYETLGYYSHLDRAIRAAIDYHIKRCLSENTHTLEEAVERVRQVNEEFATLLEKKTRG